MDPVTHHQHPPIRAPLRFGDSAPWRGAPWLAIAAAATAVGCGAAESGPGGADVAVADTSAADTAAADTSAADAADSAMDDGADAPDDQQGPPDTSADNDADGGLPADTAPPPCTSAIDCPLPLPCYVATCSAQGACGVTMAADGEPCNDGDACTIASKCSAGLCVATKARDCDDAVSCTVDSCNTLSGCVNLALPASTTCDDGNACTSGDVCVGGACEPGATVCGCQKDADCGKHEDGDLCNGTLYCDKSVAGGYVCKVNPATVVTCSVAKDGACQTNTCIPSQGACVLITKPANTPCDDGNACTVGDACDKGLCQGGTDTCHCKEDADCKDEEDGNVCNGTLFCNKAAGSCQLNPATVVHCQTVDDTACLRNLCDPKAGKCHLLPWAEGKPCDDGNSCTPNEACVAGSCASATNACECQKDSDCKVKEDGNLCNGTLYCDVKAHACVVNPATVVKCNTDDDPACMRDVCDPGKGACAAVALPKDGTVCDDNNPCTAADHCQGGACVASTNVCQCSSDADCKAKEDGNLCNGTLYCDKAKGACVVNPATVVECPKAFDEVCLKNQCNTKTGTCGMKPALQGNRCPGPNVCSAGGWCDQGACEVDQTSACACQKDTDCKKFDDGNLCNGTLYCELGGAAPVCKLAPASVVICNGVNDSTCKKNLCAPTTGQCAMTATPGPCDDGDPCTAADACVQGACKGGQATACQDGNACTADSCVAGAGCVSTPQGPAACDDKNPCTGDSCAPVGGCVHSWLGSTCSDGKVCTTADVCLGGACQGKPVACDDGKPCTADSCDEKAGGCVALPAANTCTDGNVCTTLDGCVQGACKGGPALGCDDGSPCTIDGCDAKTGCTVTAKPGACNDGNACTSGDTCQGGLCTGAKVLCDDGKPCTDDACDAKVGCVATPNKAPCDDSKPCTVGDTCAAGACSGTAKVCDDKNPCTADSCIASTGACTAVDNGAQSCNDNNPCTNDICHPVLGCGHAANTASCEDGNPCTDKDMCQNSACVGGPAKTCDDASPCTDDSCDPKKGCVLAANTKPCSDGVGCTAGDACSGGKCVSGKIDCNDGNACTDDACDYTSGKCVSTANTAACNDGDDCTTDTACKAGTCVAGKLVVCDDGSPCTKDYCDALGGCKTTPNDAALCKLGTTCTAYDICKSGACQPGSKARLFDRSFGNSAKDEAAYAMTTLPDGGAVLAGISAASTDGDSALVRVDAAGDVVWESIVSESNHDHAQDVGPAPDGNLLASGFGFNNFGIWLAKYDLQGKKLWRSNVGGYGYWNGYAVTTRVVDGQTQHVVCGSSWEPDIGHARLWYFGANGDPIVNTKWNPGPSGYQHSTDVECIDVAPDGAGGLVWVGWTNDVDDPNPYITGDKKAILDTVDKGWGSYDVKKVRSYGGSGDEAFYGLAPVQKTLPGWFAVGSTTSKGAGKADAWIVRLDAKFQVSWDATLGMSGDDRFQSVAAMPDGGAVAVGAFTSPGQTKTFAHFARYDALGNKAWSVGGGTGGDMHELFDVGLVVPSGDVLMAGVASFAGGKAQYLLRRVSPWGQVSCAANACGALVLSDCDDKGNLCTYDHCHETGGCKHTNLSKLGCTDGNACTAPDQCTNGACIAGAAVICDDQNPCTTETCDKAAGCQYKVQTDGVPCATGKACKAGVCQ